MNLVEVYYERVQTLKTETPSDLEDLLEVDDRSLIFVLIYFYLVDKDLSSYNLIEHRPLCYVIYAICTTIDIPEITKYYNRYVSLGEIQQQVSNIGYEFKFDGLNN